MTLHRRPDEAHEVDPDDGYEAWEYTADAEERHCADLCERCGLKHDEPAERCPSCNATHLKVQEDA